MKYLLSVVFSVLIVDPGQNLVGSAWTFKVNTTCIDTLKLKSNGNATDYDCEMNYVIPASYVIVKDTLIVTDKDDSHSEDGGKVKLYRTKYLIKKNVLYEYAIAEKINGKWYHDNIVRGNVIWHRVLKH